ncbi:MAG: ATP-binding cassette domain-containing protein [Miltoncostaeaceae bacterium]
MNRWLVPDTMGPEIVAAAPTVRVREIMRRFWPDLRPFRWWLALSILMAAVLPAIATPSGAGKSTLARMLLRFDDPDDGSVRYDGIDLRDLRLGALRENVAVLLQETLVLEASARENIAVGRPGASEREIEDAVRVGEWAPAERRPTADRDAGMPLVHA